MQVDIAPQALRRVAFQTLPEVGETEADGALDTLYQDIRRVLGVSQVGSVFRVLGPYPDFLQKAWSSLRDNTVSPAFDHGANQLRAEALKMVMSFPSYGADLPLLARLGYLPADTDHIRQGICTFQYMNPHLLLWVAALRAGRERELGQSSAPSGVPDPEAGNPVALHLVPPGEAPPEVALRYRGLMQLLAVPVVASEFQFMGGYPTYFYHIYPHLQELIAARGFYEAAHALAAQADRFVLALPYRTSFIRAADGEAEQRLDLFYTLLPRLILLMAQVTRRLGCAREWYAR